MSSPDRAPLEDLDPELRALFESERAAHAPEPFARDEVLARIERGTRMAALGSAIVGRGIGLGTKIGVAAAIGLAAAGGVVVGRATAPVATVTFPPAGSVVVPPPPADPSPPVPPPTAAAAEPTPTPRPASRDEPQKAAPSAASSLAQEQALIDTARGALARGRPHDALDSIERHAQRFPSGALAEEREALAVQALVLDGRSDAARTRADRFKRRYPQSIFAPAVDRAVGPTSGPR